MMRRAFLLNGLAILAVVFNHATSWGITVMFWWTDCYRPVTVPNFDQIGTLPYYMLLVVRKLTVFSVPAFLFASGFFVAYAARGSQSSLSWKMIGVRLKDLLVPYVLWSGVIFLGDALQGITYTPAEYFVRLFTGEVTGGYYFVPLLCQFYVLSPVLVSLARTRVRWLLLGSGILQMIAIIPAYLGFLGMGETPAIQMLRFIRPQWLFFTWAFFFTLGVVSGFYLRQLQHQLIRYRGKLLVAVIVLGALATVESEIVFRLTGNDWPSSPLTIWSSLYAVAFIFGFLSLTKIPIPVSKTFQQLASRTYGIYLLHAKAMESIARVIRQIAPWVLAHQVLLFQPVVFVFGLGAPLLLMATLAKSPARRSYRYVFG